MLLSVTVETNSKSQGDIGTRLIQAELASGLKTVESTKSRFEYPLNYRDRRELPAKIKTTDAVATVLAGGNAAYAQPMLTLPVHDGKDITSATTNQAYKATDLIWGLNHPADESNKSIVYVIVGGFKVEKLYVDLTIAEIIALV